MCKLEVWIVALRMFSLGLVLGFVAPAVLVLLPISAAAAAFHGDSMHHRQQFLVHEPGFRLTATGADSVARMAGAVSRAAGRVDGRRPFAAVQRNGSDGPFASPRSGARKAVPITRGQDLGLRFRPDERDSNDGYVVAPQGGVTTQPFQSDEHTQFRPAPAKRKRTYEELQAETAAPQSPIPPPLPYPMMPAPPMPAYQPYFPHW